MTKNIKKPKPKHSWAFKRHIKPNTFIWKSSQIACKRLKEALSEIKAVFKKDSRIAAYGIVDLAERIWPSFEHIDSSSGSLGTTVFNVLTSCVPIFSKADLNLEEREALLERLFEAIQEDGVDYLSPLSDGWGELSVSKELASKWADKLISTVKHCWMDERPGGYFSGTTACLSALLAAGRYKELRDLLDLCSTKMWHYEKFAFQSLVDQGKKAEAIRLAQDMASQLNAPMHAIYEECEKVLLSSGLYEEAYEKFGLLWTERNSKLSTFRAISKKYPQIDKKRILEDLIANSPGEEGKWFATAKEIGEFELATELALKSPCDPRTLNRAAAKHIESNPEFSMKTALASLFWLCGGYGYEVSSFDVMDAYKLSVQAGERLGEVEAVRSKIKHLLSQSDTCSFAGNILSKHFN